MSYFKNIILKNIKNEKERNKISDNLGPLRGEVKCEAFDSITGKKLFEINNRNAVTYQGKSSLIKLLSQTITPHTTLFDANEYKISKLRLGNAPTDDYYTYAGLNPLDSTVDNDINNVPLHYYDIAEKSYRNNLTLANLRSGAGGKCSLDSGQIQSESGTNVSQDISITSGMISTMDTVDGVIIDLNSSPFTNLLSGIRAPSPNTLSIELFLFGGVSPEVTASFINNKGYNRKDPTLALEIPNAKNHLDLDASNGCRLFFDYNDNHWKVKIRTKSGIASLYTSGKFRVKFAIGKYNVINSIVPKTGFNKGFGLNATSRFGGSLDYYTINSNNNFFIDSEADDISVTFNCIINGPEGNGEYINTSGFDVIYTEAFLFNEKNELFSMVKFEDPIASPLSSNLGFIKNKTISYNISWKISAFI